MNTIFAGERNIKCYVRPISKTLKFDLIFSVTIKSNMLVRVCETLTS